MSRLTVRDGEQVLYVKDGESYPYPLMSHYDICRVLERLAELEDMYEDRLMKPRYETYLNVTYPRCSNCNRTLWPNSDSFCGKCGKEIDWEESK